MVELTSMKILRRRQVAPIIGCSRMTVWRMERAGAFPKRIQINCGSVGWLEHEVDDWLAQRMANRVEDEPAGSWAKPTTAQSLNERISQIEKQANCDDYDDSMDGDNASALASAGWGTDEDYVGGCDRY